MAKKGQALQEFQAVHANHDSVERRGDGTTVIHHHVKEWKPQAHESLPEIESIIDSWGRSTTPLAPRQDIDLDDLEARVDKLTRKVKGTQKVTVTEKVTEWVEGPAGSGPINVEEEPVEAWSATKDQVVLKEQAAEPTRPKRRFSLFGKNDRTDKAKATEPKDWHDRKGETGYQPQCSALTADGAQCRNSSREGSKYCISHFGYQPPTVKGLAQRIEGDVWSPDDSLTNRDSVRAVDTRPAVKRAPDTRLRTRKPAKRGKASRKKR